MIEAITPQQVFEIKRQSIPIEIIAIINDLLIANLDVNGNCCIKVIDIISEIEKKLKIDADTIIRKKLLDIEFIYSRSGWNVDCIKPTGNENFEAYFSFKPKF